MKNLPRKPARRKKRPGPPTADPWSVLTSRLSTVQLARRALQRGNLDEALRLLIDSQEESLVLFEELLRR